MATFGGMRDSWRVALLVGLVTVMGSPPASARVPLGDAISMGAAGDVRGGGRVGTEALPDIFGPGAVLNVGNVHMKITNNGFAGNPFLQLSSDPAGQWPGASGVEYLNFLGLAAGAVNLRASDPNGVRRVSFGTEWRPATLNPEDKIYRSFDGAINGTRFFNDDGDDDDSRSPPEPKIDEDFQDGHDNDLDGSIDEDFGALGQQMYSCVMWDNTIEAVNTTRNEKHVPIGLECRHRAWAYSVLGFQDFNVLEYEIFNRSGEVLDSLVVGFLPDMDAGPLETSNFFQDDFDLPRYPSGEFTIRVGGAQGDLPDPPRLQDPDGEGPDSALCPRLTLRINGFSTADDNGDENRTAGIPSVLLINHTTDPLGISGPRKVGFKAFRSFTGGTPYTNGGNPTIDQQRFEFMTGSDNVDQETGFITKDPGETKGDYAQWFSVGPWRNVPPGGSITVIIAFAVSPGTWIRATQYPADYARYQGLLAQGGENIAPELIEKYPSLANAITAQIAYEGIHERREGFPVPDAPGRETAIRLPPGSPTQQITELCDDREPRLVLVDDQDYSWFDFDCDFCTGVWDRDQGGLFHKTWNAAAPPPNPNLNVAAAYNYSDNPDRALAPAGDRQITLAWDNLSETTPDPKTKWFDFRGYRVWKVSDWRRPVGSPGPSEGEWQLLGEFRLFDYQSIERNYTINPLNGEKECPRVWVPNYPRFDPGTGTTVQGDSVAICLDRGDLWDQQSGQIIKPNLAFGCVTVAGIPDSCETTEGCILNQPCSNGTVRKRHYPVGRYQYIDREVKNGFVYFYSVTAFDSVTDLSVTTELGGRRSAVEAEGVAPQASTKSAGSVWVVPNPYKGFGRLAERPSAWDLTPNAADPTGTHIDFMGLPRGQWTIRIYTVSGDLVAVLNSTDEINQSIRPPVTGQDNETRPGFNRQQDNPNDGQARWNLISRNGQDVVSGIYLFTVESGSKSQQRGRFVVIR